MMLSPTNVVGVAHWWNDTRVEVVPECLPYMGFGATTGDGPYRILP
jgi:hypothetical protein